MNKRFIPLALLPLILAPVAACSSGGSGGSGGSSSGCAVWRVSQDGAVVTSTVNNCADTGSLQMPSGGPLAAVSGVPAHGAQVCDIGNGWTVYTGPNGDPNGEAQGVCGMFNNNGS